MDFLGIKILLFYAVCLHEVDIRPLNVEWAEHSF